MNAAEPIRDGELADLFRPLEGRRLALAISGGVDSMVLLHLVARWITLVKPSDVKAAPECAAPVSLVGLPSQRPMFRARAEWTREYDALDQASHPHPPIVVLTVDHGLRPDSGDDAAFVADEARCLGLPVQILRWVHPQEASAGNRSAGPPTSRLQERARAARYDLLADAIEDEVWTGLETSAPIGHPLGPASIKRAIVTAHHRDDQVETFLMRLQRGTGLDGLAAMRSVETLRRAPTAGREYLSSVDLCRPLLAVPKERLVATARQRGITWRRDRSNEDLRFERVRLRRDASRLEELGYGQPALHRTIGRLQSARDACEHELRRWMHGTVQRNGIFHAHGGLFGEIVLHSDAQNRPPQHLLLGMLRRAITAWGGDEPELSQLENLIEDLDASLREHAHLARTLANCRVDLVADAHDPTTRHVRIWREIGRQSLPEITLHPGDGGWWDNRFAVSVAPSAPAPVVVRMLGPTGVVELKRRAGLSSAGHAAPPGAYASLPAIWHNDALVSVPEIENYASNDRFWLRSPDEENYRARFDPVAEL